VVTVFKVCRTDDNVIEGDESITHFTPELKQKQTEGGETVGGGQVIYSVRGKPIRGLS